MQDLGPFRQQIDKIDQQIIDLLHERMAVSHRVAAKKRELQMPIRDAAREAQLLAVIGERGDARGLDQTFLIDVYELILSESRRLQEKDLAA